MTRKPLRLVVVAVALVLGAAMVFWWTSTPEKPGGPGKVAPSLFSGQDPLVSEADAGTTPSTKEREEYLKLHQALPGNFFLPPLGTEEDRTRIEKRNHLLVEMRRIHDRMETQQATPAETKQYLTFRLRYNRDRAALLRHLSVAGSDGRPAEHIQQMLSDMEKENTSFQEQLKTLGP